MATPALPPVRHDVTPLAQSALEQSANADGGWPYTAGAVSRIEPTAWVTLAGGATGMPAAAAGARFLAARQDRTGLVNEDSDRPVNYACNGLALLAFASGASERYARERQLLQAALLGAVGRTLAENRSDVARQDNRLSGWPWIPGTSNWVEPTSTCLLALKRARAHGGGNARALAARVAQAEALLFDRACRGGGWNYGNPNVYGRDLPPYVPTTAWALLALQDRRDCAVVREGLAVLERRATSESSGLALGLALLCLHLYERPGTDAVAAALTAQWSRTRFLGNLGVTALALYALALPVHDGHAFRL